MTKPDTEWKSCKRQGQSKAKDQISQSQSQLNKSTVKTKAVIEEYYWDFLRGAPSYTYIRDLVRRLCHRLISYNISGWGQAPKKVTATDLFYLRSMDRGAANVPYLLAQYLFRHAEGRKSGARLSGGYFIGRLAHHFSLVSDDGLRGLSVVTREIPLVDMGELVKLNICREIGDEWAWVAPGPKRKPDVAAGAPKAAEDAPIANEGTPAVPAPVQAPQPPPPPSCVGRRLCLVFGDDLRSDGGLRQDVRSLRGLVERSMTDQDRFSTWMISCMTQLMETSELTYQAFDGTFQGSYPAVFERRTRRKTDSAKLCSSKQPRPMIHLFFIFYDDFDMFMHNRIKPDSKFSTIVREYVTEPSTLSKSRAELRRYSVNKSVEAEEKV
ncbi:hypothetical protein Tco_0434597 [Tanacetum coccineum]